MIPSTSIPHISDGIQILSWIITPTTGVDPDRAVPGASTDCREERPSAECIAKNSVVLQHKIVKCQIANRDKLDAHSPQEER